MVLLTELLLEWQHKICRKGTRLLWEYRGSSWIWCALSHSFCNWQWWALAPSSLQTSSVFALFFNSWVERVMVGVHFHIFYRYQVWPLVQSGCWRISSKTGTKDWSVATSWGPGLCIRYWDNKVTSQISWCLVRYGDDDILHGGWPRLSYRQPRGQGS